MGNLCRGTSFGKSIFLASLFKGMGLQRISLISEGSSWKD